MTADGATSGSSVERGLPRRRALDVARLDKSKGALTGKLKRAGWIATSCSSCPVT
jgi:hypothetical protein